MGAPKTDKSGRIQKRTDGPAQSASLAGLLQDPKVQAQIQRALPRHVTPERMGRIVMTALRSTPKLAQCTPDSFLGCVMQTAQLGLEPNTPLGHSYLIPRNNRKTGTVECTVIVGYQGMIDLAQRSGRVSGIYAHAVREGDVFEYALGLEPTLRHVPDDAADREDKPITHVYAVARLKDADPVFVVLSRAQIAKRRGRSQAGNSGPWQTDFEAMCLKTAIRALWRWMPKSSEMARTEALEVSADLGSRQAFDPAIDDAIQAAGLLPADAIDAEGDSAEPDPTDHDDMDPDPTGEF